MKTVGCVMDQENTVKLNEELLMTTMRIIHDPEIHCAAKANAAMEFRSHHNFAERKIALYLNISKSEVNRLLTISKLPVEIKIAAIEYGVEKYVLLKLASQYSGDLYYGVLTGQITTMRQVRLGLEKQKRILN